LGYNTGSEFKTVITGTFAHANVTGCSDDPTIKLITDTDLHTVALRQDNGLIKIENVQLLSSSLYTVEDREEEYLLTGFIYFDGTLTEFLNEIDRCINVNNISATRTAHYIFKWQLLGFTAQDLAVVGFEVREFKDVTVST
jgi:hypothetical protein